MDSASDSVPKSARLAKEKLQHATSLATGRFLRYGWPGRTTS